MAKQTLKTQAPNTVSDLDSLAKQIHAAHVAVLGVLLTSVQRAAEAGHLLAQAKEQVPHGQWETWVKKIAKVSPRTARNYMRIETHWAQATKSKRQAIADLGLAGFLDSIAKPKATILHVVERVIEEEPRTTTVRFRVEDVVSGPKTIRVGSMPAEDPEPASGPEQDRLAATMKSVREAEERSGASRLITGDSIQSTANLDGINREWDKLDMAGRDKFLSEKLRTHGHPDHSGQEIIDVGT